MRAFAPLILAALAGPAAALTVQSSDFTDGGVIESSHVLVRCGGQNVSPGIAWSGAPAGTKSFVITTIDHDVAPNGWVHWVVADISLNVTAIARGAGLPPGARGVTSNMGSNEYAGPCPRQPPAVHHYQFTVYAMPMATTAIAPNEKANVLEPQLKRAALATASITGTVKQLPK